MKLYAWQPNGHGQVSFFVVAPDEETARAAVEADIERRLARGVLDDDGMSQYECNGWGTDYYTLTVAEPGSVVLNDNQ